MQLFLAVAGAVFLAAAVSWTAESSPQQLFNRTRDKVIANVTRVPRYTCVETIDRTVHMPQYGHRPSQCAALSKARAEVASKGILLWRDRLRVDVAVADGREIFSWAGASRFETNDLDALAAGGSTGSGAFGSFLSSVFGNDAERFTFQGTHDGLAVFNYLVPLQRSHYTYRMNNGTNRTVAYAGSFYTNPATADLKRLVVRATEFPPGEVCSVEDTMDYTALRIGSGEFLLPEVSRMTVLHPTGEEGLNETRFSSCREYVGESTIRFEEDAETAASGAAVKEALRQVPAGTHLRVHPEQPVDSDRAAAGDAFVAVVDREVKVKGQLLVRAGDKLRGRILRIEQFLVPMARWKVTLRFDTIERDGVEQPIALKPLDDALNRVLPASLDRRRRQQAPPPERKDPREGIFTFDTLGKLVLDQKFRSEWEVMK